MSLIVEKKGIGWSKEAIQEDEDFLTRFIHPVPLFESPSWTTPQSLFQLDTLGGPVVLTPRHWLSRWAAIWCLLLVRGCCVAAVLIASTLLHILIVTTETQSY